MLASLEKELHYTLEMDKSHVRLVKAGGQYQATLIRISNGGRSIRNMDAGIYNETNGYHGT